VGFVDLLVFCDEFGVGRPIGGVAIVMISD
jgi:hypothetical protein